MNSREETRRACLQGLEAAIERAGGLAAMARLVGVKSRRNVDQWRRTGRVPDVHVRTVARKLKMRRRELRPDLYD